MNINEMSSKLIEIAFKQESEGDKELLLAVSKYIVKVEDHLGPEKTDKSVCFADPPLGGII